MKIILVFILLLAGCTVKNNVIEVNGGQGVYIYQDGMYINGSKQISHYTIKGKLIKRNDQDFKGYQGEINHMGALSGDQDHLYAGVEYFDGSQSKNLQVGIYDRKTLALKKCFNVDLKSGQKECAAVAFNDADHTLYLAQWGDDDSSQYFYHYSLDGLFLGKVKMKTPVRWIQGIAFYDNKIYVTSDDGEAQKDQPDHVYVGTIKGKTCSLKTYRTLDDVRDQGEIEGLSVTNKHLYVLYNRGAKVVNGKVTGLEKGYKKQLHEVYIYNR